MNFNKTETNGAAFRDVQKLFLLTPFVPNMVDMSRNLVEQAKKVNVNHIVKQSAFGSDLDEEYSCNSCNTLKVKSVFILKVICYLIPLILSPVSSHAPELPT